jgi:hypothetical protein
MKIRLFLFSAIITGSFLVSSSQLNALGLGLYGTASKADYTWTYHIDESPNADVDSDVSKIGLGFVLDTCLAKDNLFNYRLNIGYAKLDISNEKGKSIEDMTGNEYSLYNTFGFGIFRSEVVRFWLGPQIGFGWTKGEYETSGTEEATFWTIFYSYAIVTGLNFNIEDLITIGVDGGYRISKHAGTADFLIDSYGITATGKEFFANFSVMFRINDVF